MSSDRFIVRIMGLAVVAVLGTAFLWKLMTPGADVLAGTTSSSTDPAFSDKGLSDFVQDIIDNKPKEGLPVSDNERIPTADGIFVFTTPKGFSQGIDEKNHSIAFYLSKAPGQRNEQVVMMFVIPIDLGPKGNGLYFISVAAKRTILNNVLGIGKNYQAVGKVETDTWLGFRRGLFKYTFDSLLTPGRQRGMEMLIYKNDQSSDGLWVHIQMPENAWDKVYPTLLASLETLRLEK